MPKILNYNRQKSVKYAKEYAFKRNKKYYNFDELGGDCTNFISQCLYEANAVNNSLVEPYWYYVSLSNRSPSWTSVEFFYYYIINNNSLGPFAENTTLNNLEVGDIIQLKFANNILFSHALIITKTNNPILSFNDVFVSAHTRDCLDVPLSNFIFEKIRYIKIKGVYVDK